MDNIQVRISEGSAAGYWHRYLGESARIYSDIPPVKTELVELLKAARKKFKSPPAKKCPTCGQKNPPGVIKWLWF